MLLYHLFGVRLCYCECFCSASVLLSVYFLEIAVCFNLTHMREEHYIQQYCLFAPTVTNYNEQAS